MEAPTETHATLAYATPAPPTGSGLAAGVWITLAGLALVFLGGCFCIGIMICLNIGNMNAGFGANPAPNAAPLHYGFITLLYFLAFACFGAAAFVLYLGIRKLLLMGR